MEEAIANLAQASKPYHDSRSAMRRILEEVAAERTRQDKRWGGPEHDDALDLYCWENSIQRRLYVAISCDGGDWRREMIKVAALAVAAVESLDRKAASGTARNLRRY